MIKIILILITLLTISARTAHAQTATVSATPSPETINRIQEAINKNLKTTEAVLSEASDRLVGYTGTVTDIKEGVIALESGQTVLQVSFGNNTALVKDGKALKPELISVNDKAIVIGNLTGPEIITAKRIVVYKEDTTKKIEKRVVLSPIVKINTNSLTLKLEGQNINLTLGKSLKLDLKTLTTDQNIFGIIQLGATPGTGILIQAKII